MYSNSSLSAIPLWDSHCLQIKAYLLVGPSPTRNSTNLSRYPLSRGNTGLGRGGPGTDRPPGPPGGRTDGAEEGARAGAGPGVPGVGRLVLRPVARLPLGLAPVRLGLLPPGVPRTGSVLFSSGLG